MSGVIDPYSVACLFIHMLFGTRGLASGTGFVWRIGANDYLVTNWHNVTGKNPLTGAHLDPKGGEPDRIQVQLPVAKSLGSWGPLDVPLLDGSDDPRWLEHKVHRKNVDVVAVPIQIPAHLEAYPINVLAAAPDMAVAAGNEVFVLGFPFGLTGGGRALPVWKRGSIATEPAIDLDGLPKLLIDTASRPGMSGAPVIRRSWGSYMNEAGSLCLAPGPISRFVGVYSGRIGAEDDLKAQLGIVWRADVVEQIISHGVAGSTTV